MSATDRDQQEEELCALEAIYGEDCLADRDARVAELPGEVVLFNWIDWLKEESATWQGASPSVNIPTDPVDSSDTNSDDAAPNDEHLPEHTDRVSQLHVQYGNENRNVVLMAEMSNVIISAEPFTERRSTFQAHMAPVSNVAQVQAVMAVLLQNNKIRNATHNIMAYRIHLAERNTFLQDADDDGEDAAGGRLLHLLQVADARNVVVVVSRWFGGILLGPSRFTHINNAARILLEQQGVITNKSKQAANAGGKKAAGRKK